MTRASIVRGSASGTSPGRAVRALLAFGFAFLWGCRAADLVRYAIWPDAPVLRRGEVVRLGGLGAEVQVVQRPDGLWRIRAQSEQDAMMAEGYLVARDRMFQLDLFRHMARGELAALLGNVRVGERRALDVDRWSRFLGFYRDAARLYDRTSAEERAALEAFVAGINGWIDSGRLALEHRLLGVGQVRRWQPEDSVAIYLLLQFGLSSNADREVRRLLLACGAGLDAMERIWPTDLDFGVSALPVAEESAEEFPIPSGVVPEVAAELPALCAAARADRGLARDRSSPDADSLVAWLPPLALFPASASNNWAVAGSRTRSGKPIPATRICLI